MEVVASSHLFENAIRWKYNTLQLENEQSIFSLPRQGHTAELSQVERDTEVKP